MLRRVWGILTSNASEACIYNLSSLFTSTSSVSSICSAAGQYCWSSTQHSHQYCCNHFSISVVHQRCSSIIFVQYCWSISSIYWSICSSTLVIMSADHLFITAAQHLCWSSICPQSCLHLVIPLSHYLSTQKLFSVINFLSAYHSYVTSKWSHSLVSVKCLIFNLLKVNILN